MEKEVKERKNDVKKTASIPWVFFIQTVHKILGKSQSLTGAEQQVALEGTLQLNSI